MSSATTTTTTTSYSTFDPSGDDNTKQKRTAKDTFGSVMGIANLVLLILSVPAMFLHYLLCFNRYLNINKGPVQADAFAAIWLTLIYIVAIILSGLTGFLARFNLSLQVSPTLVAPALAGITNLILSTPAAQYVWTYIATAIVDGIAVSIFFASILDRDTSRALFVTSSSASPRGFSLVRVTLQLLCSIVLFSTIFLTYFVRRLTLELNATVLSVTRFVLLGLSALFLVILVLNLINRYVLQNKNYVTAAISSGKKYGRISIYTFSALLGLILVTIPAYLVEFLRFTSGSNVWFAGSRNAVLLGELVRFAAIIAFSAVFYVSAATRNKKIFGVANDRETANKVVGYTRDGLLTFFLLLSGASFIVVACLNNTGIVYQAFFSIMFILSGINVFGVFKLLLKSNKNSIMVITFLLAISVYIQLDIQSPYSLKQKLFLAHPFASTISCGVATILAVYVVITSPKRYAQIRSRFPLSKKAKTLDTTTKVNTTFSTSRTE